MGVVCPSVETQRRAIVGAWTKQHRHIMKLAIIVGCTGCDSCRWVCKANAISFDHEGAHVDASRCIGCAACVPECPSEAIRMVERTVPTNNKTEE